MKLIQLRYFVEIVKYQCNISNAAKHIFTSQAGVSKQILLLEEELNVPLFVRRGKNLVELTREGKQVYQEAINILDKVQSIKNIALDVNDQEGLLTIATTHTQARYILPPIVNRFISNNPNIQFSMQQGNPKNVAQLLKQGDVDLAIATESLVSDDQILSMPCYRWGRCIIVKKDHPLVNSMPLQLADIVKYPIITYVLGFTGRYKIDEVFLKNDLSPNIVLTAVDADVIKTYVRLGLGIGIIAKMAYLPEIDQDLIAIDAENLFGISATQIALSKNKYIRKYIYQFIKMFSPHLTKDVVKGAMQCVNRVERDRLFADFKIPKFGWANLRDEKKIN